MTEKKKKRSFTLSEEADTLMAAIAKKLGISKAAVVEISVRKYAEELGITPD